ncbi:MAG: hypothetical protein COB02_08490 [Candidatus Cloacimonadota bacterium]|nr:MAG: hypothetical protein COB02_08490 [Candidatus Cloacimonadota bacterium]
MGNNQLKIVIILGSSKWGGGEKHVYDIIEHLQKKIQFTLITQTSPILKEKFSKLKTKHLEWNMNFKSITDLLEHKKQISYLNTQNFSGVHCHLNDASFMLSTYRPFITTKILSTVHGFSSHLYYLFPHHLISVSQAIHNYLLNFSKKKSTIIYNGISKENIINKQTKDLQAYIFATIHPNKGQEFVTNTLKNQKQDSKICFIGTGPKKYQNQLKQAIKSSNNDNISWIPLIGDLKQYYKQASFIIIPSYKEALSYVALEALNFGVPVLASSTGGLKEVFEHEKHGLFFKAGDSSSFLQMLSLMEKNHLIYRGFLKKQPFLDEKKHFKVEEMCNKLYSNYIEYFS